jgi:hypothetical protein
MCNTEGNPILTSTVAVTVSIGDANDNAPLFSSTAYTASVVENSSTGTSGTTLSATDADATTNAEVSCSLVSGHDDKFSVDATSGGVSVAGSLDRETVASYTIVVKVVVDHGTPSLSSTSQLSVTVLDVNDNAPAFSSTSYSHSIIENSAAGTPVGTIAATNADLSGTAATIVYSINSGNTKSDGSNSGLFTVDSVSGVIVLSAGATVDAEVQSSYSLTVTATDQGTPALSSTSVIVVTVNDVNDNTPAFVQSGGYSFSVLENSVTGTSVGTVAAMDADISNPNNAVSFSITGGNTGSVFSVDSSSGVVSVAGALDRESTVSYSLTLHVQYGGNPSLAVTVSIGDANDSAPVLANAATATMYENDPVGMIVTQIMSTDADVIETTAMYVQHRIRQRCRQVLD